VRPSTLSFTKGTRLIAELHFTRRLEKQGQGRHAKQERFRLQWEADSVGIVTSFSRATKPGVTASFR